jgi:hypothetical protein
MAADRRSYRRTEAGRRAWQSRRSGLPPAYRTILGLLGRAACCEDVVAAMPGYPRRQVLDWLDELDTLCFVESQPLAASSEPSSPLSRAA